MNARAWRGRSDGPGLRADQTRKRGQAMPGGRAATLQQLARGLGMRGDAPALVVIGSDASEEYSYRRLADLAGRLAAGLGRAGLAPGESVALLGASRPEWIVAALGVLARGGVLVPLDAGAGDDLLEHFLRDSGARLALADRALAERLGKVAHGLPLELFRLDEADDDDRGWRRLLAANGDPLTPEVAAEDRALLLYTSGTTGLPKGVPLTHANCVSNLWALLDVGLLEPRDRVLAPLPLHHIYPLVIGCLAPLAQGATVVLPLQRTGAVQVRALVEGRVTAIVGVPRLYAVLLEGLERRIRERGRLVWLLFRGALGLATWLRRRLGVPAGSLLLKRVRTTLGPHVAKVASGGARLPPTIAWRLEGLGWTVCTGYGLTETSPILTFNVPGARRLESAGRPLPGVELRIAAADDPDGGGEVQARGPNVFTGYHNLPEATAEAFTADGWFRTGDRGRLDTEGYLHLAGRVGERLVLADGRNVNPEAVEAAYQTSPVIREIAVMEREGRLVGLVVPNASEVRRRGASTPDAAVRQDVTARSSSLRPHERLSDYVIVREALPRTRLDKLQRHRLPDILERAQAGTDAPGQRRGPTPLAELSQEDRALLEDPSARRLWERLAERFPGQGLSPDTSLQLDLGLDSLEWMGLTLDLRGQGVVVDEAAMTQAETVRDLLRAATERPESGGEARSIAALLDDAAENLTEDQRRWLEPRRPTVLGATLYALAWVLMHGLFRLRVEGRAGLPSDTPIVLAPNHLSYLDPPALVAALPHPILRRTYWGGDVATMFGGPLRRLVSREMRVVPVDPGAGSLSSLTLGGAVIQRGMNLVWFPEGRRSPTGRLQPFLPGVGLLLDHFGTLVVPVCIRGTDRALPPHRWLPRPARVVVRFGTPRRPEELAREGSGENRAERISDALRRAVAELGAPVEPEKVEPDERSEGAAEDAERAGSR